MNSTRYRSLYWRIAVGFIVCIASVIAIQGLVSVWLMERDANFDGSTITRPTAAAVSRALEADRHADVETLVRAQYPKPARSLYVILADGQVVSVGTRRASAQILGSVSTYLARTPAPITTIPGLWEESPFWAAPIVVHGEVVGIAGLVPATWQQTAGWTILWVGVALLTVGTAVASRFIFGPAHRRLRDLETVALKLGAGDLTARAEALGDDEVAALARAFNRMAGELGTRAEQLAAEERTRRLLLADVSHELMTPLTAVRGFQEKLANDPVIQASAERARFVGIIGDETQRLERIVGDLLDLARLDNAGDSLTLEDASVEALFGRVTARHAADAEAKSIALETVVDPGAEVAYLDRFRIEQALQNLTMNALRHTPQGGRVELRASERDGWMSLSVKDTGHGISESHQSFIFDRFYKVDRSRNGASSGSGLGLSIVKAIAERHGGRVSVSSAENQGATFTILLPPPGAGPEDPESNVPTSSQA